MKYAILLTLLGLAQIALAVTNGFVFPLTLLLVWSGASWLLVGAAYAYAGLGHRIFGKRMDGTMAWGNTVLLFPYLGVTWFLWHVQRIIAKESPHHEIVPNLYLGRRCSRKKMPHGIKLIVDLTAEFGERQEVCSGRDYLCVPTLDASVPSAKAFHGLVQAIVEAAHQQKPVYIHCAKGYGRSATVMMAALIATGKATTVEEAEQTVRQARRGVKINPVQRRLLERWAATQA